MAKTLAERFMACKPYKDEFGDRKLTNEEERALTEFAIVIEYNHDRVYTLLKFMKQGYEDWVEKWGMFNPKKALTLEMQILLYGEKEGTQRYDDMNKRKTSHFDTSSESQTRRAKLAAQKLRGSKIHSIRCAGFWMAKGMTEEEANAKVSEIQATNTLKKYINKYGQDIGERKFNERKETWTKTMSDPKIQKSRSLGLWRYIERYGENEGKLRYIDMRKKRNSLVASYLGRASEESLINFAEIIEILNANNIAYKLGVDGNSEWFIVDTESAACYFYDLTIPSLSIIIEYHGSKFHPNPDNLQEWADWQQLYTGKSAAEAYAKDQFKKKLAENNGWAYFEIYAKSDKINAIKTKIIDEIKQRLTLCPPTATESK